MHILIEDGLSFKLMFSMGFIGNAYEGTMMLLDLHKLRIFVAVVRLTGFSRAADYLHMTQPTVSQQVAMLEAQIGARLIERDTRRLRLTPAGESLLPNAEK